MPSGNLGFKNLGRDTVQQAQYAFNNSNLKSYTSLLKESETIGQNLITQRIQEDKNVKLNSLKGLFVQSGDDMNTASLKANSFYNRIDGAKDGNELNSVYEELDSIREQASLNNRIIYKGEKAAGALEDKVTGFGKFVQKIGRGAFALAESAGLGSFQYAHVNENTENELRKTNPNEDIFKHSYLLKDEEGFFNNIKSQINQKKIQQFGDSYLNQYSDLTALKKDLETSISNPNKRTAFNKLKNSFIDNEFTVKGSDFFRDGEDADIFRQRAKQTLNTPDNTDRDHRYFHYDSENTSLGSLKASLNRKLEQVWNTPIKNKKGETVRDEAALKDIRDSMSLIDKRQKELSKVYAVNDYEDRMFTGGGREGSWIGSLIAGIKPLAAAIAESSTGEDDFRNVIETKGLYQPIAVTTDIHGNSVMSNQAVYTKKDGSLGFNGSAIFEGGLQMVGQIVPVLAVAGLAGGLVSGIASEASLAEAGIAAGTLEAGALAETSAFSRGALSFSKGYDTFNKASILGKELHLADRVSTFASVYLTTYPMIESEEKKYGGNYKKRALWKTAIESTTEAVGFPDIGALKMRPMATSLIGDAARVAGKTIKDIPISDRLSMYFNTAKEYGKLVTKQNITEAFEEEMSLIGNYMYESMDSEEFKGREKTRLNADTMLDTFTESFVAGLLYSAGTTGVGVRSFVNKDNLQKTADWNAANNPELMKAKIKEMNSKGKINDEDAAKSINRVTELHGILKSAFGIDQLKDAKARLEDKDAQYEYFQNLVARQDLSLLDYDSLSGEGKELFKDKFNQENIAKNTGKRIDEIKLTLAELKVKEGTSEGVTEEKKVKVGELNDELNKLSFLKKAVVKRSKLTPEQTKYLKDNDLFPEDKPFTKEDFDAELGKVDTAILKTQKRIDKYVNLSAEDKQKVLDESYNEQIDAIKQITNPAMLERAHVEINAVLDHYEKTGTDFEELDKKNAERIRDAYAQRFSELTEVRNEQGLNVIEEELSNINHKELVQNNDLNALLDYNSKLEDNKKHINQGLYDQMTQRNEIYFAGILGNVSKMTQEDRVNFLTEFLDKITAKTTAPAFELSLLNKIFVSPYNKVEFTQEELDAARQQMIDKRAIKRATALVNKGTVVSDSNLTEEEKADKKNFEEQVQESLDLDKNEKVDESGKNSYEEHINKNYAKQKAASQKLAGDKWRGHFVNFFINQIGNYFGRTVAAFTQGQKLSTQLFMGEITLKEFNTAWDTFGKTLNASLAKAKPESKEQKNLQEKLKVLGLFKNYINKLYKEDLPEEFELKKKTTEEQKAEKVEKKAETITEDTVGAKRHEEFLTKAETRKERLLALATPARSNAYELVNGVRESDPVNLRRLRALDELAQTPDAKMRLMSKQEYIRQYLKLKFPDFTPEQVAASLQTIIDVFTDLNQSQGKFTSEEIESRLNQVYELVGDGFFSQRDINYYTQNPQNFLGLNTPLMIAVDNEGILLFEGYPLELSVYAKEVPSPRVSTALEDLNITDADTKERHRNNKISLNLIQEAVKSNPSLTFDLPFEVTAGVVPTNENEVKGLGLRYEPIVSLNFAEMGIDENQLTASNLVIAGNVRETIFGKQFIFYPGRIYFNFNGNPVQLNNLQMDPSEAQALTEIIFRSADSEGNLEDFPYFRNANNFANYLRDLVNQTNQNDRLYFFANPKFGQPGESPIIVKRKQVVEGKSVYTTLNFADTLTQLSKTYYKADRKALAENNVMPRFFIGEDGVDLNEENSYAQYIFQTHEMPIVEGKPYSLVNKTVLLEEKELQEVGKNLGAKMTPQTPTPPAQPKGVKIVPEATPQTTENKVDKDGYEIIYSDVSNSLLPANVAYFPSREEAIQTLKSNVVNPKYIEDLEKMTDEEYNSEIKSLSTTSFPNPAFKNSKKQDKIPDKGLLSSVEGDMLLVEIAPGVTRVYGLTTADKGTFVLKFNYNREQTEDPTSNPAVDKELGVKNVVTEDTTGLVFSSVENLAETPETPEVVTSQVPAKPAVPVDEFVEPVDQSKAEEVAETCKLGKTTINKAPKAAPKVTPIKRDLKSFNNRIIGGEE